MFITEHRERHTTLHRSLDELVADYISSTERRLSETTVMELIEWSHRQTLGPDHDCPPSR